MSRPPQNVLFMVHTYNDAFAFHSSGKWYVASEWLPSGFDRVSTMKSNSTRSIAAHPCEKRKDGAPSVGMVYTKIVKGGPPTSPSEKH